MVRKPLEVVAGRFRGLLILRDIRYTMIYY